MDEALADCLLHHTVFDHASNLGGLMAREFARPLNIPAYIYDAVTSDELLPEARVTGFKEVTRTSFCHVLNARATGHKYAQAMGRRYEDMNLVVAHLGAASPSPPTAAGGSSTRCPTTPAPSPPTGAAV